MKVCSIQGCDEKFLARGYCSEHYWQWKNNGDPLKRFHARKGTRYNYKTVGTGRARKKAHRLVMEQVLGRSLTTEEQVHHINGDKQDNRPENLKLTNKHDHHAVDHYTRFRDATSKECKDCGQVKSRDDFAPVGGRRSETFDPHRAECRLCQSERGRRRRQVRIHQ